MCSIGNLKIDLTTDPILQVIFKFVETSFTNFTKTYSAKTAERDITGDITQNFVGIIQDFHQEDPKFAFATEIRREHDNGRCPDFCFSDKSAPDKIYIFFEAKILSQKQYKGENYLIDYHKSGNPAGGIQRFRRGCHSPTKKIAAMFGYVLTNDFAFWREEINRLMLDSRFTSKDENIVWSEKDHLTLAVKNKNIQNHWTKLKSKHDRTSNCNSNYQVVSDQIELFHYWLFLASDK